MTHDSAPRENDDDNQGNLSGNRSGPMSESGDVDRDQLVQVAAAAESQLLTELRTTQDLDLQLIGADALRALIHAAKGKIASQLARLDMRPSELQAAVAERVEEVIHSTVEAVKAIRAAISASSGSPANGVIIDEGGVRSVGVDPVVERGVLRKLFVPYVVNAIKADGVAWAKNQIFAHFGRLMQLAEHRSSARRGVSS